MKFNRKLKAYKTIGNTFGSWVSPIVTGLFLFLMRTLVSIGLFIDKIFYKIARDPKIKNPIVIVGNPRSGTTFLQRYLINSGIGSGSELWQLIYPSLVLQKIIKPLLPILEKISPARHHSTIAHKTSLTSVETDDVGLFFRYFDGFFLYGFLLAFDDEDLFNYFDPKVRNTSKRDFDWFERVWSRKTNDLNVPYIGKLFSLSTNLPSFQKRFPDAKILYIWYGALKMGEDKNTDHFCSELGWREFSYSQLYHNPSLSTKNLQVKFDSFPWDFSSEKLLAWQKGLTGIPMVDAGMRELWKTGYMHNRSRMIVGSFLVKNLLIDWREGERWFWDTLCDADLANNSAGWQWIAGCGADATPYFRIFNPVTQGEKFDPDGNYVRRFIPEIAKLPNKFLSNPWQAPKEILQEARVSLGKTYPNPIVDLKLSRERALSAFKSLQ